MHVDPSTLSRRDAYHMLISCVIPRPIGWASTVDDKGNHNLAPFSFFGGVSSDPLTVMLSIGRRRGVRKDTSRNLIATREAVLHICHRPLAEAMVKTSAEVEPDTDEFELAGLTPVPSLEVRPPRIAEAAIAMEAAVQEHLEVGNGPNDVFLLEIVHLYVADEMLVDGLPDPGRLAAVGRLGGSGYCDTAAPFDVSRPD
ncbi:MAG: flavin reductase family protein [Planctomycetota bacterium]|nr:flavin reductase family protein [Planctomycetota bacterium]